MSSERLKIEGFVSSCFALSSTDVEPSYKIKRAIGSSDYKVTVVNNGVESDLFDIIHSLGLVSETDITKSRSSWNSFINDYSMSLILDLKCASKKRLKDEVMLANSGCSLHSWEMSPEISNLVWPKIITSNNINRKYLWIKSLYDDLSGPFDKKTSKNVVKNLMRIIKNNPKFEINSNQFLMSWASNIDWAKLLIKNGFTCHKLKNEQPLFSAAIFDASLKNLFITAPVELGKKLWRGPPISVPAEFSEIANPKTTPSWFFACSINLDAVKSILKNDPGIVNIKDDDGLTGLHYAVYAGNLEIVKELLANGADPTIKNKDDAMPIDFVPERRLDIESVLLIDNKLACKNY